MNCLFILVLFGCCGRNPGWGWNGRRNGGCCQENRCGCMEERRHNHCGCAENRGNDNCGCTENRDDDNCGCRENRNNDSCGCRENRDNDSCGCTEKRRSDDCGRHDHITAHTMRYDEGMRSYGCMDVVPEMRKSMMRDFPIYPEGCNCND